MTRSIYVFSGGYNLTVPMFIVVLLSKFVASIFNHGIYEIHLELAGVPFLDANAPKEAHKYKARDIMAR